MQTPLFVRPLTADERATLETGLRSPSAFTVRRCQSLLTSAEGQPTPTIARQLHQIDLASLAAQIQELSDKASEARILEADIEKF